MKHLFFILFYCFIFLGCFQKQQKLPVYVSVPVMSQTQDISGFIRIDRGPFTMGSPKEEPGRNSKGEPEALRDVIIDSFYIAQYEVTQREYYSAVKNQITILEGNENFPVNNISWYGAIFFCNKLSELHGLEPVYTFLDVRPKRSLEEGVSWNKDANGYRLPTSAEWECAIRAGTRTPYYTGEIITESQANFNSSYPTGVNPIMPVGSYAPNPWGLYDMAGNVSEWCWEWYEEDLHSSGKIIRGGCYYSHVNDLRSAAFSCSGTKGTGIGFRLARSRRE